MTKVSRFSLVHMGLAACSHSQANAINVLGIRRRRKCLQPAPLWCIVHYCAGSEACSTSALCPTTSESNDRACSIHRIPHHDDIPAPIRDSNHFAAYAGAPGLTRQDTCDAHAEAFCEHG
jgi:hypothetical protein